VTSEERWSRIDVLRARQLGSVRVELMLLLLERAIERLGNECVRCKRRGRVGVTEFNGGTPIEWRCCRCGGYVCIECTLTVPGSVPREFYEDTYCSEGCRDGG